MKTVFQWLYRKAMYRKKSLLALLAVFGISTSGPLQGLFWTGGLLPSVSFTDLHCHVAGMGFGNSGCFVSPGLADGYKFPFYLKAFGVTEEELRQHGDSLLVDRLSKTIAGSKCVRKAVILALDGVITDGKLDTKRTQFFVPNEYVAEQVKKHSNLLFGASVNPRRKDCLERLEWANKNGAVLLKWIPSIMDIDPADEALVPFYQKLKELRLPLLTHTGQERSFGEADDKLCDPLRLELPLKLGVTVIAAHIATTGKNEGQDNFERCLPLFKKYPNLYADISSLTQVNKLGYLRSALLNPDLKGRLVYGSDWPLQFFPLVSPWYHLKHLSFKKTFSLTQFDNPWDRDVALKKALGTSDEIFLLGDKLLK